MFGPFKKRAPNETVQQVPEFGIDPHGAALFHGLTNANAGHLNGPVPVMDLSSDGAWGGWSPVMQKMTGLAYLGGGGSRPTVSAGNTFDQGVDVANWSPAERIFLERMQQGRYS